MGFLAARAFVSRHQILQVLLGVALTAWYSFTPWEWLKSIGRSFAGSGLPRIAFWCFLWGTLLYGAWLVMPAILSTIVMNLAQLPPIPASASWFVLAIGVAGLGTGIFFAGIAAILYTSWYFITIARSLDAQLAREFGVTRKAIDQFHGRLVQSEGSFNAFDEETAAMHEELDKLKAESPSMSDDEYTDLKEKIEKMGVGAEV